MLTAWCTCHVQCLGSSRRSSTANMRYCTTNHWNCMNVCCEFVGYSLAGLVMSKRTLRFWFGKYFLCHFHSFDCSVKIMAAMFSLIQGCLLEATRFLLNHVCPVDMKSNAEELENQSSEWETHILRNLEITLSWEADRTRWKPGSHKHVEIRFRYMRHKAYKHPRKRQQMCSQCFPCRLSNFSASKLLDLRLCVLVGMDVLCISRNTAWFGPNFQLWHCPMIS